MNMNRYKYNTPKMICDMIIYMIGIVAFISLLFCAVKGIF